MKSPFKFLDSFTKEDREIFFGREKEIDELYRRVFRGKIMLVYGVSGTGKSSLINCGLANKFQDEDWLPVNVRRGRNIIESMYGSIISVSLTPKQRYTPSESQFRKFVKSLYLDHYKPVFFIFDQFEELFIFGTKEEKSQFVSIVRALVESDIQCRFIFVMREEYMANVTEFEKQIPAFFANRIRIENMDINNAIQAIEGPCKVSGINLEKGFPEALIENLSPGSPDIELTYLQVFLDKIFRLSAEEAGAAENGSGKITFRLDHLKKTGNVSDLLGSFLNEQISLLNDPDTALAVLKSFVSIKGTKRQMTIEEVRDYSQTLGKPVNDQVLLELLQNFVGLRILRDKDQHERYELRHDSLATKIYEKISMVEKDILEIRQFVEDGYHNWQKRGVLLNAADLEYIGPFESRLFLSNELLIFIARCKNELEKVKQKRRVIYAAATLILLILFAGFTVWALIERNASRKQEVIARANYFNALSKELVPGDPTKALRLAGYAFKLLPSENNYQNLVDIYSGNEFYTNYPAFKESLITNFRINPRTGDILLLESNKLKVVDQKGRTISESGFNISQFSELDISPGGKKFLSYRFSVDSLKVYDYDLNLEAKTFFDGYYIQFAGFVSDSDIVVLGESFNSDLQKIFLWSPDGTIKEAPASFQNCIILSRSSSDTIYIIQRASKKLFTWIPGNNTLINFSLAFKASETPYYGISLPDDKFMILTSLDSMKTYEKGGRLLSSWYAGDDVNRGFFRPYLMPDANLLCAQNQEVIKFWDLTGNTVTNLKLEGSQIVNYQFSNLSGELLILLNNQLISFKPDTLNNELVYKITDSQFRYYTRENYFVEYSGTGNHLKFLSVKNDGIRQIVPHFSKDKYYYKLPGMNTIFFNFPDSFSYNGNHRIIIYDLNDNPLIRFRDSTAYPNRLVFSNDSSIIMMSGRRTGTSNFYSYLPLFRLYNIEGEPIKDYGTRFDEAKLVNNNKNILSLLNKAVLLSDTSGRALYRYSGQRGYVYWKDISMDNNYVLSGADDKTVRIWSRNGELLKVIQTEGNSFNLSFLPGQLIFQIIENSSVKLYNVEGVMIQKVPSINWTPVIYSPENRFIYYLGNEGIFRTRMKIPVDSFLVTNNHNDLSLNEKIEYNLVTTRELLSSDDPLELYRAGRYFQDNISTKVDVSEITRLIKTSESLYRRGLKFDTLNAQIACRLTELNIEKSQYSGFNLNREIDKLYNLLIRSDKVEDLLIAFNFYGSTVIGGGVDSSEIAYGYYDKMISISNKILELAPENKTLRTRIARAASNLSFGLLDFREYNKCLAAVKLAVLADSTFQYSYTNLPLAYLFNGQFDEAALVYEEWKDKPWTADASARTFREIFLLDLDDLESRGIVHPDFEKARELLRK